MKTNNILDVAKVTLNKIQLVFPNAIVAGGLLRDTVLDKHVSDIDIFIKLDDYESASSAEGRLAKLIPSLGVSSIVGDTDGDSYGYSYDSEYISEVYEYTVSGHKIQVIMLRGINPIEYVADEFNCNLSKIWSQGIDELEKDMCMSPEFRMGKAMGILMFNSGTPKSYMNKISKKYHEYDICFNNLDDLVGTLAFRESEGGIL